MRTDLSTVTKMVAMALSENVSDDGECWSSLGTISRLASCDERSARRSLKKLSETQWLYRVSQGGTKGTRVRLTTTWELTTPDRESTVIPGTGSGVDARTPDTESTEPRTHSPETRDTESTESVLEPVHESGREAAHVQRDVYALARSHIENHPAEIDCEIEIAIANFGIDLVESVVAELVTQTARCPFASKFTAKLKPALTSAQISLAVQRPRTTETATRAAPTFVNCTGCDRCDDHHGWLADASGNLVGRCPTANDRSREAAA